AIEERAAAAVVEASRAAAPSGGGLVEGAQVRFRLDPAVPAVLAVGVVREIGARSVAVETEDGTRYRRAAADLEVL
ncbi:MAG TPA: hypothetical protein VMN04_02555, partial [Thermoanaerobaculia bacterium]|nr:hypothetical protein [Thermoanaerobaculia bacterium]